MLTLLQTFQILNSLLLDVTIQVSTNARKEKEDDKHKKQYPYNQKNIFCVNTLT